MVRPRPHSASPLGVHGQFRGHGRRILAHLPAYAPLVEGVAAGDSRWTCNSAERQTARS